MNMWVNVIYSEICTLNDLILHFWLTLILVISQFCKTSHISVIIKMWPQQSFWHFSISTHRADSRRKHVSLILVVCPRLLAQVGLINSSVDSAC